MRVVTVHRSSPCLREHGSRAYPQRLHALAGLAQLLPVPLRLLQVVGDDLLVLHRPIARGPLQPVPEALVELRPLGLGQRLIGGVADEDVAVVSAHRNLSPSGHAMRF